MQVGQIVQVQCCFTSTLRDQGPYGIGCIKGYLFVAGGSAWVYIFIVTVASGQVSSVSCEHCPRRVLTDEWVSGACQIGSAVCVCGQPWGASRRALLPLLSLC